MSIDSSRRKLLVGALLAGASLAVLFECRSGLTDVHQRANQHAVAEWNRNMEILERGLAGRPLHGIEFESACLFFETLTSIPVRGNGATVGYLPTDETRKDVESLKQWFAKNKGRLYWDEEREEVRLATASN